MKLRPAGWAWVCLAGYVTVTDIALLRMHHTVGEPFCTMSESFGDALRHPRKRWPIIASWALLTLHLFGPILPAATRLEQIDPIGKLANRLGRDLK